MINQKEEEGSMKKKKVGIIAIALISLVACTDKNAPSEENFKGIITAAIDKQQSTWCYPSKGWIDDKALMEAGLIEKGAEGNRVTEKGNWSGASNGNVCFAKWELVKITGWDEPVEILGKKYTKVRFTAKAQIAPWLQEFKYKSGFKERASIEAAKNPAPNIITVRLEKDGWRIDSND